MATIVVVGNSAGELSSKVMAVLAAGVQPIGDVILTGNQSATTRKFIQVMGANSSTITDYEVIHANSLDSLAAAIDNKDADQKFYGDTQILGDMSGTMRSFVQVLVEGGLATGGGTVTLPAAGTASEIQAGTVTATRLWSPKVIHDEIARQIAAIPAA